jgi:hypothetical protein
MFHLDHPPVRALWIIAISREARYDWIRPAPLTVERGVGGFLPSGAPPRSQGAARPSSTESKAPHRSILSRLLGLLPLFQRDGPE